MPDQEKLQNEKEELRTLTLEERWQMDEEMQKEYGNNYLLFEPQCRSCRFAKEGTTESCQKYDEIPWEILTVQKRCPHCRKPKDQKPQIHFFVAEDRQEILEYDFWPEEELRRAQRFPVLAVWAYDGDEPVCGAVFTRESDAEGVLVVLQYIYTLENFRELGIASDVMKYAEKLFVESGTGRMAVFLNEEEKEEKEDETEAKPEQKLSRFFQALDWEESSCEAQSLEYMPKSMMSEKVKSFATGNREGILSLSEETRRRILSENPGLVPELKEYLKDGAISANSLVYMPDRKVEGAVILQKKSGYQMCIRYLYVSPECQGKTILLRLLAIVLGNRENWSGRGNVLIHEPEAKTAKLVEYLFGEPYKRLNRKKYENRKQKGGTQSA